MKYITQTLALLLVVVSTLSFANGNEKPTKVFFIGNSFTGAYYLPTVLQKLAVANHKRLIINGEIKNGTALYQHWEAGKAQQKIQAEPWDYVILQDASASALEHPNKTLEFGQLFAELAKKSGAKPLLFNTWAYNGTPSWVAKLPAEQQKQFEQFIPTMYHKTNALYQVLSILTNSNVVPVGQAWHQLTKNPSINLYDKDGSHPSPVGTYLAAVMFYQAIFHEIPKVLPTQLTTQQHLSKMEHMVSINIDTEIAKTLVTTTQNIMKARI